MVTIGKVRSTANEKQGMLALRSSAGGDFANIPWAARIAEHRLPRTETIGVSARVIGALRCFEVYGTQLFVLHFKIQTGLPFFSAGRSSRTSYGCGSLSQLKV